VLVAQKPTVLMLLNKTFSSSVEDETVVFSVLNCVQRGASASNKNRLTSNIEEAFADTFFLRVRENRLQTLAQRYIKEKPDENFLLYKEVNISQFRFIWTPDRLTVSSSDRARERKQNRVLVSLTQDTSF
jgi:hypothetical protein